MTTRAPLLDGTGTSAKERRDFLELLALPAGAALLEVAGAPERDLPEGAYDAVLCIDGIATVPGRAETLDAWARALKDGGRLLYTDPALVAGLLTSEEIAVRSGDGVFVLAPQGENESLLEAAGFRLLRADDATDAMAEAAESLHRERGAAEGNLVEREGRAGFDAVQRFLVVTHRLATERRLARIAFLAEKLS